MIGYPVYDTVLPDGVEPLRDLSSGLTLVACHHRLPREAAWCPFCLADARMTDGFTLPVKRLVVAPKEQLRLL